MKTAQFFFAALFFCFVSQLVSAQIVQQTNPNFTNLAIVDDCWNLSKFAGTWNNTDANTSGVTKADPDR